MNKQILKEIDMYQNVYKPNNIKISQCSTAVNTNYNDSVNKHQFWKESSLFSSNQNFSKQNQLCIKENYNSSSNFYNNKENLQGLTIEDINDKLNTKKKLQQEAEYKEKVIVNENLLNEQQQEKQQQKAIQNKNIKLIDVLYQDNDLQLRKFQESSRQYNNEVFKQKIKHRRNFSLAQNFSNPKLLENYVPYFNNNQKMKQQQSCANLLSENQLKNLYQQRNLNFLENNQKNLHHQNNQQFQKLEITSPKFDCLEEEKNKIKTMQMLYQKNNHQKMYKKRNLSCKNRTELQEYITQYQQFQNQNEEKKQEIYHHNQKYFQGQQQQQQNQIQFKLDQNQQQQQQQLQNFEQKYLELILQIKSLQNTNNNLEEKLQLKEKTILDMKNNNQELFKEYEKIKDNLKQLVIAKEEVLAENQKLVQLQHKERIGFRQQILELEKQIQTFKGDWQKYKENTERKMMSSQIENNQKHSKHFSKSVDHKKAQQKTVFINEINNYDIDENQIQQLNDSYGSNNANEEIMKVKQKFNEKLIQIFEIQEVVQNQDEILKKVEMVYKQFKKQEKFINCLKQTIQEFTNNEKNKENITIKDMWQWIKFLLKDYMNLKQQLNQQTYQNNNKTAVVTNEDVQQKQNMYLKILQQMLKVNKPSEVLQKVSYLIHTNSNLVIQQQQEQQTYQKQQYQQKQQLPLEQNNQFQQHQQQYLEFFNSYNSNQSFE